MADDGRFQAQADIFKALGHPARLTMVHAMRGGERTVGELTEIVGSDMSTVSRHLSVLRSHGIVSARKDGTTIRCTLHMGCVSDFLTCVNAFLEARDAVLKPLGEEASSA